jgi:hypothetical protein
VNPLRILISIALLVAATVGSSQPALASSQPAPAKSVHLVATIHGAGTAVMDAAGLVSGDTTYSIDARLFSDGKATGFFDCVDLAGAVDRAGNPSSGDIRGPITSWKKVHGKITLSGIAKLFDLGGNLLASDLAYTITIQKFGGAGKGHWTLDVPAFQAPNDPPVCSERLTSGRLVMRQMDWEEEGSN